MSSKYKDELRCKAAERIAEYFLGLSTGELVGEILEDSIFTNRLDETVGEYDSMIEDELSQEGFVINEEFDKAKASEALTVVQRINKEYGTKNVTPLLIQGNEIKFSERWSSSK